MPKDRVFKAMLRRHPEAKELAADRFEGALVREASNLWDSKNNKWKCDLKLAALVLELVEIHCQKRKLQNFPYLESEKKLLGKFRE